MEEEGGFKFDAAGKLGGTPLYRKMEIKLDIVKPDSMEKDHSV